MRRLLSIVLARARAAGLRRWPPAGRSRPSRAAPAPARPAATSPTSRSARGQPNRDRERAARRRRGRALHQPARQLRRPRRGLRRLRDRPVGRRADARALRRRRALPDRCAPTWSCSTPCTCARGRGSTLPGWFNVDAISPTGRWLYLIHYPSAQRHQPLRGARLRPGRPPPGGQAGDRPARARRGDAGLPDDPRGERGRPLGLHALRPRRRGAVHPRARHRRAAPRRASTCRGSPAPTSPACASSWAAGR